MSFTPPLSQEGFGSPRFNETTQLNNRVLKAKRRTTLIKISKVFLPILLTLCILAVVANAVISKMLTTLPFKVDNLIINGNKLQMVSPNLGGYTKDGKAYKVTAERAEQEIKNPAKVDLINAKGEFDLNDGAKAYVTALEGTMQTDQELIELRKNVLLTTTNGQEVKTSLANINAKLGTIHAPKFIEMRSNAGEIQGDSMEFSEGGKVIIFIGNVKGIIY